MFKCMTFSLSHFISENMTFVSYSLQRLATLCTSSGGTRVLTADEERVLEHWALVSDKRILPRPSSEERHPTVLTVYSYLDTLLKRRLHMTSV
jgi:hypothetical protein